MARYLSLSIVKEITTNNTIVNETFNAKTPHDVISKLLLLQKFYWTTRWAAIIVLPWIKIKFVRSFLSDSWDWR